MRLWRLRRRSDPNPDPQVFNPNTDLQVFNPNTDPQVFNPNPDPQVFNPNPDPQVFNPNPYPQEFNPNSSLILINLILFFDPLALILILRGIRFSSSIL